MFSYTKHKSYVRNNIPDLFIFLNAIWAYNM